MKFNPLSPRWQHDDPAVRLESIESGKLSEEVLKELASKDTDANVQRAAIMCITDLDFLRSAGANQAAASQRWAELVGADLQNLASIEGQNETLLTAVAQFAPKEEFRLQAVEHLPEPALCKVLYADNLSRVHQHCASAIENEANLQDLQKHFAQKDKNVSRILKSKLQAIKHERDVATEALATRQALLARVETLRNSEPGSDYGRRIDALKIELAQLPDQTASESVKAKQLLGECAQIYADLPKPAEILAEKMQALSTRIESLRQACVANAEYPDLDAELAALQRDWPGDAEAGSQPALLGDLQTLAASRAKWQMLISRGKNLGLEKYQQQLSELTWPEAFPKPEAFTEATQAILTDLQTAAAESAESRKLREEIDDHLSKFELELGEGHIKAANRANARVSKLLQEGHASTEQSARANLLQNKLQDLKDWQGFATQPKRDDLCNKMELLANDESISLPEKAKAIKELQEEWKKLGASDSRAAQKSWTRFKTLGDQAYAPVAEFYAQQQAEREQQLKAREAICLEIEAYERDTDWEAGDIDWRQLSSFLQSRSTKWRQHANVPRRNKKAIEKRFAQAIAPLQERLNTVQKKHIAEKDALIQELKEKLADENSDTFALMKRAKAAQQEWKQVGFIERRKDQKLWKAFRAQCDAVFSRRDEEKQSEQSAANELAQQYRSACQAFAAKLEDAFDRKDIAEFRKQLAGFQLPKSHRGLERDSKKLISQAEKELKQRARQSAELMFREFQRRCEALDKGEVIGDSDETLSAELTRALEQRPQRNAEEQDLILIRLEILSDLPSPEASQGARMAYQVERLNRELSKGEKETRSEREQVQDLLIQWFSTSNKLEEFKPRFLKIANKLGLAV
jgi:hypothetical protein